MIDATEETGPELLARLGDDANKWASEFNTTATRLGYSPIDEGWLIGWFANAIKYSYDLRTTTLRDRLAAAERKRDEARASEVEAITDQAMREIRIARLTEALEKAREGLEPFVELTRDSLDDSAPDDETADSIYSWALFLKWGDIRRAHATITAIDAALKAEG
jgi:hypothetical protein